MPNAEARLTLEENSATRHPDEPRRRVAPAWAALFVFAISYCMPFAIAWWTNVFDESQLRRTVLDGGVCEAARPPRAVSLTPLYSLCTGTPHSTVLELHLMPFFPGTAGNAWPVVLLMLLMLFQRTGSASLKHWRDFVPWFGLFASVFVSTNWGRESANTFEDGRRIISYTNWDVSKPMWCCMMAEFLCLALLLACIWANCLKRQASSIEASPPPSSDRNEENWPKLANHVMGAGADGLSNAVYQWIKESLLLAAGCLPLTFVYWRLVGEFHDFRYFPPGLAFHLIWAASACVITIPLGKELQQYAKYRRNALAELAAARHCSAAPDKLPQLSELSADMDRVHPKATLGVAFAGVTSLISLLAPLLQLLKK